MQRCGSSRSRQKIRPRFSPQSLLTDWGALALDLESHRLHCRQEFRGRAVHECELIVTVRGGSDQIRRVDQYNRAPCAARAIDGGGDELCSCRAARLAVPPTTPTRSRPSNQIREGKQCEDVRAGTSSSSRPQGQYRSSCAGARIGTQASFPGILSERVASKPGINGEGPPAPRPAAHCGHSLGWRLMQSCC